MLKRLLVFHLSERKRKLKLLTSKFFFLDINGMKRKKIYIRSFFALGNIMND